MKELFQSKKVWCLKLIISLNASNFNTPWIRRNSMRICDKVTPWPVNNCHVLLNLSEVWVIFLQGDAIIRNDKRKRRGWHKLGDGVRHKWTFDLQEPKLLAAAVVNYKAIGWCRQPRVIVWYAQPTKRHNDWLSLALLVLYVLSSRNGLLHLTMLKCSCCHWWHRCWPSFAPTNTAKCNLQLHRLVYRVAHMGNLVWPGGRYSTHTFRMSSIVHRLPSCIVFDYCGRRLVLKLARNCFCRSIEGKGDFGTRLRRAMYPHTQTSCGESFAAYVETDVVAVISHEYTRS